MASKKQRRLKKQRSAREHKLKMHIKNNENIKLTDNIRQNKRALNEVLAFAEDATHKAQTLIDKYNDDDTLFYNIYNSIIHKIMARVNSLKPIDVRYNKVNALPAIPSIDNLTEIPLAEYPNTQIIHTFNDAHSTELTDNTDWSAKQLSQLHNSLMEYKEQLGLYNNSQFATNYEKAGELIDDSGTAIADLNKIIVNEINTVPNNSTTTFRLIKMEFESKVAEKFYSSDQARQMRVLHDYIHVETGNADDEDYYNQL